MCISIEIESWIIFINGVKLARLVKERVAVASSLEPNRTITRVLCASLLCYHIIIIVLDMFSSLSSLTCKRAHALVVFVQFSSHGNG